MSSSTFLLSHLLLERRSLIADTFTYPLLQPPHTTSLLVKGGGQGHTRVFFVYFYINMTLVVPPQARPSFKKRKAKREERLSTTTIPLAAQKELSQGGVGGSVRVVSGWWGGALGET